MNDPRDFLALAQFGNLGVLLLGIGTLGVLIHRSRVRQTLSAGVGLFGILLMCEGGTLFHGAALSARGSIVLAAIVVATYLTTIRSLFAKPRKNRRSH
jgi:hypothetical protein